MKLAIKAKNVLAFGNQGIEFELPVKGLILVKGCHLSSQAKVSNGVGKSSLLDVVLWGIYGTIPEKRTKADMKNDVAEKNSITEIIIEDKGKTGRIIRTIKADEYEVNEVPIVDDTLAFFIDGTDRRGHSDKETQVAITKFMGLDEESFKASAWFTADKDPFAGKTPAKQDALFIKLRRLENLEEALKITKDMRDNTIDDLSETDRKISIAESNLIEIETSKNSLENSVMRWKAEKADKLRRFDNKIVNANRQLSLVEEDLVETETKLVTLQELIEDHVSPEGSEEEYKTEMNKYESSISDQNINLGQIRGLVNNDKKLLKSAQNLSGGTKCTKCGSELTEEHLYTYRDELNDYIESNEIIEKEIEEKIYLIREKLTRVKEGLSSLVSAKNDFRELQMKVRRWNDKKQNLEIAVRNQNENLGELKKDRKELEQTEPPQNQETSQLEKRIETLEEEIGSAKIERENLLVEKERLDFWVRGFGSQGIRNLLIRNAIPKLNKHAQEFSQILTDGELTVGFSGTKEVGKGKNVEVRNKINVSAIDIYGSNKYSKASGGEKRRIDMCIDLALHFLVSESTNLPFLFVDEIFTKLDNRGKELVLVLLQKLTERIEGIIVVSNQDDIASEEFDNIWTVYRKDKQSYLVKE